MIHTVLAGTKLFRVHDQSFASIAFNPTIASDPLKGGRFDSNDGRYAYLYAGEDFPTAIAEALVRDLPAGPIPPRIIPRRSVRDRMLSELELQRNISVVSLRGADLGHVGQDPWLTKCSSAEYEVTRRWANAIRDWVPSAQGMIWRSFRDEDRFAYVLFEDRMTTGSLVELSSIPADGGSGLDLVRQVLLKHNVTIS